MSQQPVGFVKQSLLIPELWLRKGFPLAAPTDKQNFIKAPKDRAFKYWDTAAALLNADSCLNWWQKQQWIFIVCLFLLRVPDVEETSALWSIVVDHVQRTFCHKNIVLAQV